MNKLLVLAPILMLMAGCSSKLSKEEAKKLLDGADRSSWHPVCSGRIGMVNANEASSARKTIHWSGGGAHGDECMTQMEALHLVASLADDPEPLLPFLKNVRWAIVTPGPHAEVTCKTEEQSILGKTQAWCAATSPCGVHSLEVQSVTSEGRHATIRYVVHRSVPDLAADSAVLQNCKTIRMENVGDMADTAEATLDDDGHWHL
jgi:hypothetical protein